MVEQYNRTLENQLAIFVEDHQRDWDLHLPLLLISYRSAVYETTRLNPAILMFGRELCVPLGLLIDRPHEESGSQSYLEYAQGLWTSQETPHDFVRAHQQASSQRMKRRYNMRSVADTFSRGEVVWLHNPQRMKGLSPKLSRPWEGPYVVVHRVNDVEYGIQRGPRAKPKMVHRDGLRKYHGEARAYWFTESPGEPVKGVPKETPMHRETLASDDNRNALPRRRRRRRELPPDSEATAFRPVMPMLSRRDPGVLRSSQRSRSTPQRYKDFVLSWTLEERHLPYSEVIKKLKHSNSLDTYACCCYKSLLFEKNNWSRRGAV